MKNNRLVLFLILFLALFLRLYKVDLLPPSLNWDEVSHGYNAYSILKTGKDEWGINFPLIFRCFGDYKLPLYIYLTTIPVFIFGLTPFAVRLVSIFSGVGLVFVSYFLSKSLTKDSRVGLVAAFLTAITPWGLFLSRAAIEANLGALLFSLGALFWIIWIKEKKNKLIYWAFIFWGFSLFAYNSARVLVPIFFVVTFYLSFRKKMVKQLLVPGVIMAIFFIPVLNQFLNRSASARFSSVSIVDQGAVNRIIENRQKSGLPTLLQRAVYNRPVYFLTYSVKSYFSHFSPNFLFLKGADHYQFSMPGHGPLLLITAPFLFIGAFFLVLKKKWPILFWFLVAPIPSAITRDSPHLLRSIFILPLPMLISSYGFFKVIDWFKNKSRFNGKVLLFSFAILAGVNLLVWLNNYWKIYRPTYSWAWQDGYKQAVVYAKDHYSEYEKIVFTKAYGEPHEFVLFWQRWDPNLYQTSLKNWNYHSDWFWIDGFDKYEFWNDWEVKDKIIIEKGRVLLITTPGNWTKDGKLLETINYINGDEAFEIVQYD